MPTLFLMRSWGFALAREQNGLAWVVYDTHAVVVVVVVVIMVW
jgi:hypothetical protein